MLRIGHVPEQLCLPGFDVPPTDRLFFAIFPDTAAARSVAGVAERLRRERDLKGAPLGISRYHISLYGLGDYAGLPNDVVARAREAASSMADSSFDVAFERVGSFVRRRRKLPLVLRGRSCPAPLIDFHHALGEALARNGLGKYVSRRFKPHVTLLYDRHHIAEQAVEPVQWKVREFVLVHSLLGRTRHIHLGRWPLTGAT